MTEIKKCQDILQRARGHTKTQLASIAKLDKQLSKLIAVYNTLTISFLDLLKLKNSQQVSTSQLNQMIEKIQTIQHQMEQLSEQKVRLANSMQLSVYTNCQQMNQILSNCEGYQNFQSECDQNAFVSQQQAEIEEIIQNCRDQQQLDLCICISQQKKQFTADEKMIMCQAQECQTRWYHLKCLGLCQQTLSSQQPWICQYCQAKYNKTQMT